MSGIKDLEKVNQRQMESLSRKNSREIAAIENQHNNYKNAVSKNHQTEILDLRDDHGRQIAMDTEKKEKILTELKGNLDKTRDMTDKELKELKQKTDVSKHAEQTKLAEAREQMVAEHEFYMEDINDRFRDHSKKVNTEGRSQIEDRKLDLQEELFQTESVNKKKITEQSQNYTSRIKHEGQEFEAIKKNQEKKYKDERIASTRRNQADLSKMTDQHTTHVEQREEVFHNDIGKRDLEFEKKYHEHLQIHQNNLKRLDEQNSKIVTEMKNEMVGEFITSTKRSDDPFYRINGLAPVLTHHPDHVEVKVKVPDHSKQDLQLSAANKEIVLNFNRRYDDTHSPAKGVTNKLHKVETYTTRLATDFHLNPKSVKSSYSNGVMTYTIGRG